MATDTALLIVDVQVGLFERSVIEARDLLERIRDLIADARAARIPVIYVQHCGSSHGHTLHPDRPGWQIHPAIAPQPGDVIIEKRFLDAFKQTELRRELDARGIRRLIVTGLQTEMGVDATCRSAQRLGYEVMLVTDQRLAFDAETVSARGLVEREMALIREGYGKVTYPAHTTFSLS